VYSAGANLSGLRDLRRFRTSRPRPRDYARLRRSTYCPTQNRRSTIGGHGRVVIRISVNNPE
jgi:hypothetical protein